MIINNYKNALFNKFSNLFRLLKEIVKILNIFNLYFFYTLTAPREVIGNIIGNIIVVDLFHSLLAATHNATKK